MSITRTLEERDQLILQWKNLVGFVIKEKLKDCSIVRRIGDEEAISLGYVGLIRAAELYDPNRGTKFSTYAVACIRNYILQHAGEGLSIIRVPSYHFEKRQYKSGAIYKRFVTRALGCKSFSIDKMTEEKVAPKIEDIDWDTDRDLKNDLDWLESSLSSLPPREAMIIKSRFYEGLKLSEVGERIGCSKERARQLQNRALKSLRENYQSHSKEAPADV